MRERDSLRREQIAIAAFICGKSHF